jgi:hypothetical protein
MQQWIKESKLLNCPKRLYNMLYVGGHSIATELKNYEDGVNGIVSDRKKLF